MDGAVGKSASEASRKGVSEAVGLVAVGETVGATVVEAVGETVGKSVSEAAGEAQWRYRWS